MLEMYLSIESASVLYCRKLQRKVAGFFRDDRGDLVSSLGWMAVMVLVLIMIKVIIDGRLQSFVNSIFEQLDRIFSS